MGPADKRAATRDVKRDVNKVVMEVTRTITDLAVNRGDKEDMEAVKMNMVPVVNKVANKEDMEAVKMNMVPVVNKVANKEDMEVANKKEVSREATEVAKMNTDLAVNSTNKATSPSVASESHPL